MKGRYIYINVGRIKSETARSYNHKGIIVSNIIFFVSKCVKFILKGLRFLYD